MYHRVRSNKVVGRFLHGFFIGIPFGITLCNIIGYVVKVEGSSMQPTLNPDLPNCDYVFANRWSVRTQDIQRGDIVVVTSPKIPSESLIKRVVGLSGDIVRTLGYKIDILQVFDLFSLFIYFEPFE